MKNKQKLVLSVVLSILLLLFTVIGIAADDGVTVSFYDGDRLVDTVTIEEGTVPTAPAVNEITLIGNVGYRFIGWSDTNGGDVQELAPVSESTALYAVREAVEYKVKNGESVKWYAPNETTLSSLMSSAKAGDVITACSNVDIDGTAAIRCSNSFTLDLNGNTLTTTCYIMPTSTAHIVISNGTVDITNRELAQMSEYNSANAKFELDNITVKQSSSDTNRYLFDVRVGEIIMNNVTVNDGEWLVPAAKANPFISSGYKTRSVSQEIKFTVKNCNITLPAISFISAGGATNETNGYKLDVTISGSRIKTNSNIINVNPASTAIDNCIVDIKVNERSRLLGAGFSNQIIFNIASGMKDDNVNVWADYGVEFARYPKLAVGTLTLGDGDAMLEMLEDDGYGIVTDLWVDNYTPVTDYAYSFCVVGDTQMTTDYDAKNLFHLYDWILNNQDRNKIQYVFGMGDITNHSASDEWEVAYAEISKMNGTINYSLIRGNHDTSETFNAAFNNTTYKSMFDGFYSEDFIENSYATFTVGSTDFLHITLDYHPSDDVVNWAKGIVEAHPEHRVIISTHSYLASDGTLDTRNDGSGTNSGAQLWSKLVSQYENIFLVLSGHVFSTEIQKLQSIGVNGNTVTQIMVNGQTLDYRNGAMGLVAMLYFSEDGKEVNVEYYSTVHDRYLGENSQFTLSLEKEVEPLAPSEGDVFAVTNIDGTTNYYDSTYTLSTLISNNNLVLDGAIITLFSDVSIDAAIYMDKNLTIDLNGNTIDTSGGKLHGRMKIVNIINGTVSLYGENASFVYIDYGYPGSVFNIKDVTVIQGNTQTTAFADIRNGTLNLNNVTVTAEGWNEIKYPFISAGYRTNTISRAININVTNSNINLGSVAANFIGFTAHANETKGWTGNITVSNSTITTDGYIVQAKPNENSAGNCGMNLQFDGKTTLNSTQIFNVHSGIPTENISVTIAQGAKVSSIPTIAGVDISYSGGELLLDTNTALFTVASASDAACILVNETGNVHTYILNNSFNLELVTAAQVANCKIVFLKDMIMPAGTGSKDQYNIKSATLHVDLNGKKLTMPSYTRFTTDANTNLSFENGTIECAYNVFYSYSGSSTNTKFTATNVKFIATTSNQLFDHRIGVLTLTDCEFEFKTTPTNDQFVFALGNVKDTKNSAQLILTRTDIYSTGTNRSIFKLYGGRKMTITANDCDFSVGKNAFIVDAAQGTNYTGDARASDEISFNGCTFEKRDGVDLVNIAYNAITVESKTVILPTCTAQGYTINVDMINKTETKSDYTEALEHKEPKLIGASIKIGNTLALIYYVDVCTCDDAGDLTMKFTMNGVTTFVNEYCEADGMYAFIFNNIPPQCMGDRIDAELLENESIVDTKYDYSIKKNAEYLLEEYADNQTLVTLVNDLLNYGAAAQIYRGHNTDNLVTDTDTTEDVKPESTVMSLTASSNENAHITAAGVWFDYNNRIYIKFIATEGTNVTVKVNGTMVDYEESGNGNYIAYTEGISATQFAKLYTIELLVNGETVQTLTYSINSYIYAKWDSENMKNLARALYAYGTSAVKYNSEKD